MTSHLSIRNQRARNETRTQSSFCLAQSPTICETSCHEGILRPISDTANTPVLFTPRVTLFTSRSKPPADRESSPAHPASIFSPRTPTRRHCALRQTISGSASARRHAGHVRSAPPKDPPCSRSAARPSPLPVASLDPVYTPWQLSHDRVSYP